MKYPLTDRVNLALGNSLAGHSGMCRLISSFMESEIERGKSLKAAALNQVKFYNLMQNAKQLHGDDELR